MIAIDTNVLVRYLTNDDPEQARRARDLLSGAETVLITPTVLLELEWVLRAVYELSPKVIHHAMLQVFGLPVVHVDQSDQVACALVWFEDGFDFADALHLALSGAAERLITFDRRFVSAAHAKALSVELL